MKLKIQDLKIKYDEIVSQNQQLNESIRLKEIDLLVDPEYEEILKQRVKDDLEETEKELMYDEHYAKLKT